MFDLCNLNDVKYSYANEGLGFAFTFERNITSLLHQNDRTNDRTNDRIKEKLTGSEFQIYQYVLEKKIINNAEIIAKELNKSIITIQRGIKKLVELGLIERIGSNKTGYWKIK